MPRLRFAYPVSVVVLAFLLSIIFALHTGKSQSATSPKWEFHANHSEISVRFTMWRAEVSQEWPTKRVRKTSWVEWK